MPQPELLSFKSNTNTSPPPPWEVIVLVAHHLDPKALARASCVSKSWYISMSTDHIWQPLCATHYPSLSQLKFADPSISYRRLYAMASIAASRRVKKPNKPQISLENLIFVINLSTKNHLHLHSTVSIAKPGVELDIRQEVFRFDIDVCYKNKYEVLEDMKISWNLILKGWSRVFTMMDCEGKVRFGLGVDGWFSEELPSPGCCSGGYSSGLVADLKLGFCGGGKREVRVDKVSVGILNIVNWRYVSIDDGLRYLQHFLVT
ncbi:hypothetical protein JCGZ_10845 [Jatropha curcas]|uniref:F-box protein n=1 Tax=Jatropha curcas TaxID=180498 RepID=A0A067KU33_JATCU|nr:probable F-box protein At5g04010 [Jatropha curcas]XP_037495676.1 probable F-box protein At5g04010 [Jatropha curcas]KDP35765.1 hypothetical protein JCGZ_10845 [Jatropha curcas]